jgi:ferric-dicitrate binding protein FerR (iron transport regulator)
MSKQSFEYLLEKYLAGECTPAEKQLVEQWYDLVGDEIRAPKNEADWKTIKAKMWLKVRKQTNITEATLIPFYQTSVFRAVAAACVLVVFCIVFWVYQQPSPRQVAQLINKEYSDRIEWENQAQGAKTVLLSDGSKVQLQSKSRLISPKAFTGDVREIKLEGDAFFNIAHNPQKPFLVNVGNVVTKVLGTSFWIRATENKQIEVAVKTGKVAVFEKKMLDKQKDNGVVLTPNHKVTYFAKEQHFVAGLVEKPEIIKADEVVPFAFDFKNTALVQVVQTLEKAYGIELFFENELLKNCTLTGNLDGLEMYEKLDVICQSLGATYQVQGTRIVLNGKGCQ